MTIVSFRLEDKYIRQLKEISLYQDRSLSATTPTSRPEKAVSTMRNSKETERLHPVFYTVILFSFFASVVACDPENNPTTMKGRTITPARLPKVQPVRVPKIPESVREQLAGTNGQSHPAPATRPTAPTENVQTVPHAVTENAHSLPTASSKQGDSPHDPQTTLHSSRDRS